MDELILRRAQKGDASAFEQLVTPYEQMIWRVCWHYLHHREDAMDCAQEVMLKAWRSIGQYRQDCGFSSWLYRIAGSVCIDFLRKQKRMVDSDSMDAMAENGFEPADNSPTPEAALLDREEPWKVLARSKEYLLAPRELYECVGDVPNVTFPCAALCDAPTGRIALYYGCADSVTGLAFCRVDEVIARLL